jgi:Icc-related predicted phosphoesterase
MRRVWGSIPNKVDIVMTHGPMHGYHDRVKEGHLAGCKVLRERMAHVDFKVHICGHIHEGYGYTQLNGLKHFVNASVVNRHLRVVNKPIIMDYDGYVFEKVEPYIRKYDDEGNFL